MPKAVVTDGRSIDQYIPRHLRHMFYKSSYPENTYATTNGYGPYDFSTKGLVLYLPLWALKGSPFKSVDAYEHTCDVTGALWRPDGRLMDGDDYIRQATLLDVMPSAVTYIAWMYFDAQGAEEYIMDKTNTVGQNKLLLYKSNTDKLITLQEGGNNGNRSVSSVASIAAATWAHCACTYSAAAVPRTYLNTVEAVGLVATEAIQNGVAADFTIGATGIGASFLTGRVGEVWVYERVLTAEEITHNRAATAWRYH